MLRPTNLLDHPERAGILAEVHARPVEFLPFPARVRRIALLLPREPNAVADAHARFSAWCKAAGVKPPAANSRQHSFDAGDKHVTWELHTEFVTLTWSSALTDRENWPTGIGLEAVTATRLIACMRFDLIDAAVIPENIRNGFILASLCISGIEEGKAQVATDFGVDADGFTRFELATGGLLPLRRAIVVRRLLEVETYRTLSLLGLPLARSVSPELSLAESELAGAVEAIGHAKDLDQAQEVLGTLHDLSVRSGQLIERTSYRFAASRAYVEILRQRLRQMAEIPVRPTSTLARYLGNRIDPALATCEAVEARQLSLAAKIESAIELLNTRVSLDIQSQNKKILGGIADTAASQLRLQNTVEGLSTIAISYYFLGILSYIFSGVGEFTHFSKAVAVALAAPVVLLLVWLSVRAIRRRHSSH